MLVQRVRKESLQLSRAISYASFDGERTVLALRPTEKSSIFLRSNRLASKRLLNSAITHRYSPDVSSRSVEPVASSDPLQAV